MRKIASIGTVLLLGGVLVGGAAAPAQAQPIQCSQNIAWACGAVVRQVQHAEEELGRVPGYITTIEGIVYGVYDTADATIRCVVFGDCGP